MRLEVLFPGDRISDPRNRAGAGWELLGYDVVQRTHLESEGQVSHPGSATNSNRDAGQVAFIYPSIFPAIKQDGWTQMDH